MGFLRFELDPHLHPRARVGTYQRKEQIDTITSNPPMVQSQPARSTATQHPRGQEQPKETTDSSHQRVH
jgi:methylase of polypeptide subunit release factors